MSTLDHVVSVRFGRELVAAVRECARRDQVKPSDWIRRAVRQAVERAQRARPEGLIPGSGRAGMHLAYTSALTAQRAPQRTFSCQHLSVAGVMSATCWQCGPLAPAA